jgi:hypothetical protein
MIVVRGWRCHVDTLTIRPVMALRCITFAIGPLSFVVGHAANSWRE